MHGQQHIKKTEVGICHASSVGSLLADTPDDGQWTCPKHVEYFIK